MISAPIMRDVVLVGGGHSHALLIRRWAMQPLAGVRLTLVSDGVVTPYSGMLPGLIAGHYSVREVHIDLMRLCMLAGVRLINARMLALDVSNRTVSIEDRPDLHYDRLLLDTGSTPDLSVPGAREFSTPVKPVHAFHSRWLQIRERIASSSDAAIQLGVVGSGAGGFEIAMAMHHALRDVEAKVHWFLRGSRPLSGRHQRVAQRALSAAKRAGVIVHSGFDVERVSEGPSVHAVDGREVPLDELLWCTGAVGPEWVAASDLLPDARGFVLTDAYLRSVSHPDVFATGDIGTQRDTPSPKAGVYAVRQAPVLFDNLKRSLLGKALRSFRPQSDFLSLMATGSKHALASRGPFVLSGAGIWRWKDRIDRRFMDLIHDVPVMSASAASSVLPDALRDADTGEPAAAHRCRGCGAKVASDVLQASLERHASTQARSDVSVGLSEARDVAVFDPGRAWVVQSVDQISALVDDPWVFARVAVRHALADVLTQGATPHSAQLMLTLPPASRVVQQRELDLILDSLVATLIEEGVTLLGGHTAEGPELQIGLVINSLALPDKLDHASAVQAGDRLLLTRGLGTGVLFAGAMRGLAEGIDLVAALEEMQDSQTSEASVLRAHGARVMTDVTGFGLAGHLERLLAPGTCRARIDVTAVPLLEGAHALAEAGVKSSLYEANSSVLQRMTIPDAVSQGFKHLLCDPQTAGGFLAVLPAETASDALLALKHSSPQAALIGTLDRIEQLTAHALHV